mmetsp:Transcript_23605/g.53031  ORF Transcript_23605/g.53031 Transcript_23605/m.53031 type:complete len:210 (-) Transcript_23605:1804-2433(-)
MVKTYPRVAIRRTSTSSLSSYLPLPERLCLALCLPLLIFVARLEEREVSVLPIPIPMPMPMPMAELAVAVAVKPVLLPVLVTLLVMPVLVIGHSRFSVSSFSARSNLAVCCACNCIPSSRLRSFRNVFAAAASVMAWWYRPMRLFARETSSRRSISCGISTTALSMSVNPVSSSPRRKLIIPRFRKIRYSSWTDRVEPNRLTIISHATV